MAKSLATTAYTPATVGCRCSSICRLLSCLLHGAGQAPDFFFQSIAGGLCRGQLLLATGQLRRNRHASAFCLGCTLRGGGALRFRDAGTLAPLKHVLDVAFHAFNAHAERSTAAGSVPRTVGAVPTRMMQRRPRHLLHRRASGFSSRSSGLRRFQVRLEYAAERHVEEKGTIKKTRRQTRQQQAQYPPPACGFPPCLRH